jgi:uncharacterized protein YkwD
MKKLFFIVAITVSNIIIAQTDHKQRQIDLWYEGLRNDSVFLSQNKIDEQKLRLAILTEINSQRQQHHLSKLTIASLQECNKASKFGDSLIREGILGHSKDPYYSEICIATTISTGDYKKTEGIYVYLAKDLVSIWMNSPGHRSCILNPVNSVAAVGNAYGPISGKEWGRTFRSVVRFF